MSVGAEAGPAPGPLLPTEGWEAWAGEPPPWQGRQITPPWALPYLEEILEGAILTPGPLPPHPPATAWDDGRGSQ